MVVAVVVVVVTVVVVLVVVVVDRLSGRGVVVVVGLGLGVITFLPRGLKDLQLIKVEINENNKVELMADKLFALFLKVR